MNACYTINVSTPDASCVVACVVVFLCVWLCARSTSLSG
jgi:hypothetical protein